MRSWAAGTPIEASAPPSAGRDKPISDGLSPARSPGAAIVVAWSRSVMPQAYKRSRWLHQCLPAARSGRGSASASLHRAFLGDGIERRSEAGERVGVGGDGAALGSAFDRHGLGALHGA